jgi:hypothetical protein
VHAFKLLHTIHNYKPFSGSSGISNTHLNLGFGIPLLHCLILLTFPMLILRVVELTEKAPLVHVIFLDLLLFFLSSHKQTSSAQSTIVAKYVVNASCCSQILWIVHTIRDYRVTYKSVPLMCDSSNAICLAQTPVFHGRAKHIKVRHHFLRDHVEKGDIEIKYIDRERQLTNIFTKPLDAPCFVLCRGTWYLSSLCHGLRGSLCFTSYILYLIFIALHFIHIYLIYLLLHLLC